MSKLLLTTTSLIVLAGGATAEVSLTGSAEMGIVGGDRFIYIPGYSYTYETDTQFHGDMDVQFRLRGETDNGLTFGASIDLDEIGDDCGSTSTYSVLTWGYSIGTPPTRRLFWDETTVCAGDPIASSPDGTFPVEEHSVWVSGSFGTVSLGDVDGAFDWALREAVLGNTINDVEEHLGWSGNSGLDGFYDGQILRYDRSVGDFAFAVSLELDDNSDGGEKLGPVFGVGGRYTLNMDAGDITFALGYQKSDETDGEPASAHIWGASVYADLYNGIQAVLNYSDYEYDGWFEHSEDYLGLALSYTFDAWTVAANWGRLDGQIYGDDYRYEGYSLVVNYDLGGGAEIQAGWGGGNLTNEFCCWTEKASYDKWSLGVAMSF